MTNPIYDICSVCLAFLSSSVFGSMIVIFGCVMVLLSIALFRYCSWPGDLYSSFACSLTLCVIISPFFLSILSKQFSAMCLFSSPLSIESIWVLAFFFSFVCYYLYINFDYFWEVVGRFEFHLSLCVTVNWLQPIYCWTMEYVFISCLHCYGKLIAFVMNFAHFFCCHLASFPFSSVDVVAFKSTQTHELIVFFCWSVSTTPNVSSIC